MGQFFRSFIAKSQENVVDVERVIMPDQKEYDYFIPVKYTVCSTVRVRLDREDLDAAIDKMYELNDLDEQVLNDPVEVDVEVDGRENIEVHEVSV